MASVDQLKDQIMEKGNLPVHIAIIMDGNGRWARSRGLPRTAGHEQGVKAVKKVVRAAGNIGLPYLTLYTFSTENWKRPKSEVSAIMKLLYRTTRRELNELLENNVRLITTGDIDKNKLKADDIDEKKFTDYLQTNGLPDPDLLIRTSGELRVSNFLLWQMAYTEIYVTDVLWPDFGEKDFYQAIIDFQRRERRFGKVKTTEPA